MTLTDILFLIPGCFMPILSLFCITLQIRRNHPQKTPGRMIRISVMLFLSIIPALCWVKGDLLYSYGREDFHGMPCGYIFAAACVFGMMIQGICYLLLVPPLRTLRRVILTARAIYPAHNIRIKAAPGVLPILSCLFSAACILYIIIDDELSGANHSLLTLLVLNTALNLYTVKEKWLFPPMAGCGKEDTCEEKTVQKSRRGIPTDERILREIEVLFEQKCIYREPALSIEELAAHIGSNRTYVSGVINSKCGMNFFRYVNTYRVREACHLMRTTDYPIREIAQCVGFRNLSTFNARFKQLSGCTPSQWRDKHERHPLHTTAE